MFSVVSICAYSAEHSLVRLSNESETHMLFSEIYDFKMIKTHRTFTQTPVIVCSISVFVLFFVLTTQRENEMFELRPRIVEIFDSMLFNESQNCVRACIRFIAFLKNEHRSISAASRRNRIKLNNFICFVIVFRSCQNLNRAHSDMISNADFCG